MKIEKMRYHDSIHCGFSRGYPFIIVFAYLPEGAKFITGTTNKVKTYMSRFHLVHGYQIYCKNRVFKKKGMELYGYMAYPGLSKVYYVLQRKSLSSKKRVILGETTIRSCPRYFLRKRVGNESITVHSWRRMPRTYPRKFKELKSRDA